MTRKAGRKSAGVLVDEFDESEEDLDLSVGPDGPKIARPADSLVEATAEDIKITYIQERETFDRLRCGISRTFTPPKEWEREADPFGRKKKSVWTDLALLCLRNGINGKWYVRRAFALASGTKPPMPNHLKGQNMLQAYKNRVGAAEDKDALIIAFDVQRHVFKTKAITYSSMYACDKKQAWKMTLLDENIPLSALFRFCVATSEGFASVAKRYEQAAAAQYVRDKANYDAVWCDWIPPAFLNGAEKILSKGASK